MDEPRPTIDDFLTTHPCTMTHERTGLTPDKKGGVFAFLVTIAREGRTITTPYTMGIGHALEPKGRDFEKRKDRDGFWHRCGVYESNWKKVVLWPEPQLREVIDCLRCDASYVFYAPTFTEFCGESGYTSIFDHDTARKSYDDCHEGLAKLRTLFGFDGANTLVNDVEGL